MKLTFAFHGIVPCPKDSFGASHLPTGGQALVLLFFMAAISLQSSSPPEKPDKQKEMQPAHQYYNEHAVLKPLQPLQLKQ